MTYRTHSTVALLTVYSLVSPTNATELTTNATLPSGNTTRSLIALLSPGNYSSNNSWISCEYVRRSIDEFPPDFFSKEQRRNGAVIFHLLVAFYGFIFITFTCHDYFLPSVFCICSDLGISSDVAGATFMATATSISELFVSIIGTFLTESDLGVGTVVGSSVYNTLGVSACVGLAASQAIKLEKWPLLRDSGVYLVSIVVLAIIALDNVVMWYEALVMMIMYFGYFIFLLKQDKFVLFGKKLKNKNVFRSWTVTFEYVKQLFVNTLFCRTNTTNEYQDVTTIHTSEKQKHQYTHYGTAEQQKIPTITITSSTSEPIAIAVEEQSTTTSKLSGNDFLSIIRWVFCLPVTITLSVTIPDCRVKWNVYPYTFIMSIIWIVIITYILSWMLTISGDTFHVSDIVMGIAVLAFGSTIPEAISGIINAQNGEGSMSISNALGSNTMDILLCLGLPWFIKCLLPASMNGGPVKMENNSLFFNCICLIASVVILNIAAAVGGFRVCKLFGFMCLVGQYISIHYKTGIKLCLGRGFIPSAHTTSIERGTVPSQPRADSTC